MLKKAALIVGIVLAAAGGWLALAANHDEAGARPHYPHADLAITRADGTVFSFDAEVAGSPAEQAYGLMFVKSLPDNKAMIFPYAPPQQVAFWMKNTLIPLDMLFISPDGTIGRIVAQAQPLDLTPIPSEIPVIAVIEIAGGLVKRDGLAIGDRINSSSVTVISQ